MIASSPSPTLHSRSLHNGLHDHYARPQHSSSSPTILTPASSKSTSWRKSTPPPTSQCNSTEDSSTQYSPPAKSSPASFVSQEKRKGRSLSPDHAPNQETMDIKPEMPRSTGSATATPANLQNTSPSLTSSNESSSSSKKPKSVTQVKKTMPRLYENCDVKDLVQLIASMMMELIQFNDEIPLQDGHLTRFHSRAPPTISVEDYLQRLALHATLSPPILLSMVYYIDRLCVLYPQFTLSSLTVHRYLIASATVASKGLSDSFWTNNTYARVGGVSLKELALLELEFLWRIEWRIVPKPEILTDYYRSLVERNDGYELESEGQE